MQLCEDGNCEEVTELLDLNDDHANPNSQDNVIKFHLIKLGMIFLCVFLVRKNSYFHCL